MKRKLLLKPLLKLNCCEKAAEALSAPKTDAAEVVTEKIAEPSNSNENNHKN